MLADIEPTQTCNTCGKAKPLDAFNTRRDRPGWRNPRCKTCMIAPSRIPRRKTHYPPADLSALRGVRIHAGQSIDADRILEPPVRRESLPDMPEPRPGTITCRQWIKASSPHRGLFLCAGGHYAVEKSAAVLGGAVHYTLWHLSTEHLHAEDADLDERTVTAVLSYVANGVLDKPGTIFNAGKRA